MRSKNQQKFKYSCIKPEDCYTGVLYSFSINPQEQPEFQCFYRMKLNTLRDWSQQFEDKMSKVHYCEYTLTCEIGSGGRLHYHGYIKINNIVKFYLHDLRYLKELGTYEIDKIEDKEVWNIYVEKQKRFMEKYCKENDIKYILTNVVQK